MELLKLWQLIVRQRAVVLLMALLSLVALYLVYSTAPPVYRSSGSIVLFNPPNAPDSADAVTTTVAPGEASDPTAPPTTQPGYNPYGAFNDLSVMTDILVRVMNSPPIAAQLQKQGLQGTYLIGANVTFYRGPIIDVSAEADSPEQARSSVNLVLDEVQKQVIALQDQRRVTPDYRITTGTVVRPELGTSVFSGTLRRLIVVAGLCVAATVGFALLADVRRARRKARREQPTVAPTFDRPSPVRRGSDFPLPGTPVAAGVGADGGAVPGAYASSPHPGDAGITDAEPGAADPADPRASGDAGVAGDGVPSSSRRA